MASADSPPNPRRLRALRSPGSPPREGEHGAAGDRDRAAPHDLDVERLPDHLERLYRAALLLTGSREDAEDLVQETCARVLRRPRLLRQGSDLSYLLRALRNTWLNARRTPTLETVDSVEVGALGVEAQRPDAMISIEAHDLLAAVSQLPDAYRETLVAVDVLGLSYKEAARALRVREGTVMSRLFRARLRVARALGAERAQG
jgi:RNA polymerase sigma-70 factor, ECF subfamily